MQPTYGVVSDAIYYGFLGLNIATIVVGVMVVWWLFNHDYKGK